MSVISPELLASAIQKVTHMDLSKKESVLDSVYQEQPNLLASILMLQNMGLSLEKMDVLLNILITLHVAFKDAGCFIPKITERDQERMLNIFISVVKFSDGTGSANIYSSIAQYTDAHEEKIMFAYVINELKNAKLLNINDEGEKYAILAGVNLVNCMAHAGQSV